MAQGTLRAQRREVPSTRLSVSQLLRAPGVRLGFLGSLLISIAVMTPGFVPNRGLDKLEFLRWLRALLLFGQIGRILLAVGLICLFWGWIKLRPAMNHRFSHATVLAVWALPMLFAPPIFSSDIFLYADQGWIIHQGLNPYHVGLAQAGGPFAANVHPIWRGTTAVYPPLALQVQHLIVVATGFQGLISVIAMRIPTVIGVALIACFVPRIARRLGVDAELAKWFAVLNPLLLIHFVGGAHNDAMMVALVCVGVWATLRWGTRGMILASILVGLGAGFKQPGLIAALTMGLLPIATRLPSLKLGRRVLLMSGYCLISCGLAVGTFVATSLATGLGFGWIAASRIHELTWGMSPASMIEQVVGPPLYYLTNIEDNLLPLTAKFTTIVSVVVLAVLAWRYFFSDVILPSLVRNHSKSHTAAEGDHREEVRSWRDYPLRWLVWGFQAIAFGGAGFHVWYVLWGGIYLGMLRYGNKVFRFLIAGMIMFFIVEGGLEYYGLRPITGYVLGAMVGYAFYANSLGLQIVADTDTSEAEDPELVSAR